VGREASRILRSPEEDNRLETCDDPVPLPEPPRPPPPVPEHLDLLPPGESPPVR
jgi:hypothetical protein